MPPTRSLLCAVVITLFGTAAARAGDWPQLLGPNGNAISDEKGLNWDWQASPPKVLWKVPLGSGYSSLAVVGQRVYTTAKRGQRDIVVCLDVKDGKELWTYDAAPTYLDRQRQGAGPRATPTVVGGKVYCLFAMGELVCLTADGKRVWQANMFTDTGAKSQLGEIYYWGVSSSPFVEGDFVIVQPGGDKGNSVAAYHRDTGKLAWTAGNDPLGYASPIAITVAGQRCLVCPTGRSALGLDPVKGDVLWRYEYGNRFNATGANPVWKDNILFLSAAYGAGSAAVELTPGKGKWTVKELWKDKKNLQALFATPIIEDGFIYGAHGDLSAFQLRCLDLKTGAIKWSERATGRYDLLGVDGHILAWSERGSLMALKATPKEYTVTGELPDLLAYKSWALPALANGRLYLRDERHVLCLDLRGKKQDHASPAIDVFTPKALYPKAQGKRSAALGHELPVYISTPKGLYQRHRA